MLLSFSVPEMLPMLEAGVAKLEGEDIGDARVKGGTIRRMGRRGFMLLMHDPICHTCPYDLDLWWKSRRPERFKIGTVPASAVRVHHIVIHQNKRSHPVRYTLFLWNALSPAFRQVFWSPGEGLDTEFARIARDDGFDTPEDFAAYFVPNPGDTFDGVQFRWL